MANCYDCIHTYPCKYDRFFGVEEVENKCQYFKNKADFVEVVRCKDCKYWTTENDGYCAKFSALVLVENISSAFCSYGERKGADDA